jgi:hypothetical protein
LRLFAPLLAAAILLVTAAWFGAPRLQQDDAFCTSCHRRDDQGHPVPMHESLLRRFRHRPALSLAAAHAAAGLADRPDDPEFHCIDCHRGTGVVGRLRVQAVTLRDTAVWALGRAEEPHGMRVPLGDADCRRCHAEVSASEFRVGKLPSFHGRPEHREGAESGCMECHAVHQRGAPEQAFLHEEALRRDCARCHSGYVTR